MHAIRVLTLALLAAGAATAAQTTAIKGRVIDADSQTPLVGVNVVVADLPLGDITDAEGDFYINDVPLGTHALVFTMIGYERLVRTDVVARVARATMVNAGLRETVLQGEETVVTAGYFQKSDTELTSGSSFTAEELRRAPGAAQEFSRILSALPSVANQGETSQDLLVRGGSPSENGFYVDNIPVPGVSHFADGNGASNGPVGILNTEFIDNIDFYSGGFSAAYGDRVSSITEIRYRDGADRFATQADLNFAGAGLIAEGPLPLAKGSYFASGRRSYLDLIAGAIGAGGAPRFGDVQGKVVYEVDDRNAFTLLNIYGDSRFFEERADALEEGSGEYIDARNEQNTAGVNWRRLWGRGASNTSLSYSQRDLDFVARATATEQQTLRQDFGYRYLTLRNVNYLALNALFKLETGGEIRRESGDFSFLLAPSLSRGGLPQPGVERALTATVTKSGAFATLIARSGPRLRTSLGLRLDHSSANSQFTLAPRLAASFKLSQRLSLNAAAGLFYQGLPLHLIAQDDSNSELDDVRTRQYIAGIEYLLTPSTRLSVEVYEKQYRNAPLLAADSGLADPLYVLDNRTDLFLGPLAGNSRAYARGIEGLVQKKLARGFYGMASAAYFRTRYRDAGGTWRDRDFDNRYVLSLVGGYKPNAAWELSARWSYSGGRPHTPIDAAASRAAGEEVLDMAQFNAARLPDYHSLFFRADRRFYFQQRNLVFYMSLWNAYNRSNVEERVWNVDKAQIEDETQFSLLPIFGMEMEF